MNLWNKYHLANSIEDALTAVQNTAGTTRFVAGGTDLLLDLRQGRHEALDTLVDVSGISELNTVEIRDGNLFIGAAAPLACVIGNEIVQTQAHAICEACSLIGGPQVRNVATLGGNVGHALPAGDGSIALLASGAQVEVVNRAGKQLLELERVYAGPGRSILRNDDLMIGFWLKPENPGEGSVFQRIMRPQGVAIAILNMAVWVRCLDDQILDARIALGPAGPTPFRARMTEAVLRNKVYTAAVQEQAIEAIREEARFRTSPHRATSAYRSHMVSILLKHTLGKALERARNGYPGYFG